jgi:hypothetical protein
VKSLLRWNRLNGSTWNKVAQRVELMRARDRRRRAGKSLALPLPGGKAGGE